MDVVIKPSAKNIPPSGAIKRWLATLPFVALGLIGLVRLIIQYRSGLLLTISLIIIAILGLFIAILVPIVNKMAADRATVFVVGNEIGTSNLLGQRRAFPKADLSHVLLRSIKLGGSQTAYTLFVARNGRCLFKIASHQWDINDIRSICEACSVPLTGSWSDITTPRQVRKEIPNSFPWWL